MLDSQQFTIFLQLYSRKNHVQQLEKKKKKRWYAGMHKNNCNIILKNVDKMYIYYILSFIINKIKQSLKIYL